MAKFSVIIPAYNAQRTIRSAVTSVLVQDFRDLEVIVVNDGSSDDTSKVLDEIDDSRLVTYNQNNSGPSVSRNNGIEYASGEYILFLDADDELVPGILSSVNRVITALQYDVVLFRSVRVENGAVVDNGYYHEDSELSDQERSLLIASIYNKFLEFNNLIGFDAPWGKVISRKFLEEYGIRFMPDINRYEDAIFCKALYEESGLVYYLNEIGYRYCINNDSICNSYNEQVIDTITKALGYLKETAPDENLILIKTITSLSVIEDQYLLNREHNVSYGKLRQEFITLVRSGIWKQAIDSLSIPSVPMHYKVEVLLLRIKMVDLYLFIKWIHFNMKRR